MKTIIDSIPFFIRLTQRKAADKIPVVFLHGFTGSSKDWDFIFHKIPRDYYPVAIDLIGHGKTGSPEKTDYYKTKSIVSHLNYIIEKLNFDKIILAGYSMGGRAALSFAVRYPKKIYGLLLESSTPGITNQIERSERVKNDLKLAAFLEKEGVNKFIDLWMEMPIFQTLKSIPKNNYKEVINRKKINSKLGLSNSLIEFGAGQMPDQWDRIKKFDFKTLLITGEYDKKFTHINSKMKKLIPHCRHEVIQGCGHNVHLEKPEEFVILVQDFLRNFSLR